MEILHNAISGTTESCDIQIMIDKNSEQTVNIELESSVEKQFGKHIRQLIEDTLTKLDIQQAKIKAVDKGALDCTIKARTLAAVYRAADIQQNYNWKDIDAWND